MRPPWMALQLPRIGACPCLLTGVDGALLGYERGLVLALNAESMQAHFADTFTDPWRLDNVQGHIDGWFGDGYLGARSTYFRADLQGGPVAGTFALARPPNVSTSACRCC